MENNISYSYKELCKYFNEDVKPTGKYRQLQFEHWRKGYDIVKINGKNRYTLTEKGYAETIEEKKNGKNVKFKKLLEPIIYNVLANSESNVICLTKIEQQMLFGLANSNFNLKTLYLESLAKELCVSPEELRFFRQEAWALNNRTITDVVNSMAKDKLLIKTKSYKFRFVDNNDWYITTNPKLSHFIMTMYNKFSIDISGCIYSKIKRKDDKNKIIKMVNDYFGFSECYEADILFLDKKAIDFVYKKEFEKKYTEITDEEKQNNLSRINKNNCIKISKSKYGKLKEIGDYSKEKMISRFISNFTDTLNLHKEILTNAKNVKDIQYIPNTQKGQ